MVLTNQQAYAAMFRFLEQLYQHTKSDELGGILGSLSVLADGSPADPAVLRDWNDAVEYAMRGGKPGSLELR